MVRKAAGTLLLIHTALTLLMQLFALTSPSISIWLSAPTLFGLVTRAVIMQGALILLPTVLIISFYRMPAEQITGYRSSPSSLILAAVIGIPAGVVFQGLNTLFLYFGAQMGWALPQISSVVDDRFTRDLWLQGRLVILTVIVVQVLTPAVIEELMFRGVILGSLKSCCSPKAALIWQALAFSLFHSNPVFVLPPLLAGLLLGVLRQKGSSLVPAMLAHISMNLTLLAISPFLPKLTAEYLNLSTRTSSSLFYASLIATFVAAVTLVPLLALISHLRPESNRSSEQLEAFSVTELPAEGTAILPRDWKFALALLMLLATMMVTYYQDV